MKIVSLNINRFGGSYHYNYRKHKWDCTEEYRSDIADKIIKFVEDDSADIFHFQEVDGEDYLLNYHRHCEFKTGKSNDIYAFCKYILERRNKNVAIIGDFNATTRQEREQIFDSNVENEMFLDFFRLVEYREKGDFEYTWFNKGDVHDVRRLDHCFVSEYMNGNFKCIGYTDDNVNALLYPDTGFTDHSAIILQIHKRKESRC